MQYNKYNTQAAESQFRQGRTCHIFNLFRGSEDPFRT
nr:MAG TPA: hypothetical protein [Caudoviricetes sp.]DAQ25675.1 MAG TPA: hypothetical protein [Bacteriophage sp.]